MKRFFIQFIVTFIFLLGAVCFFSWKVDPFFQYREPMEQEKAYMHMPVYQTAGAARNFRYDSAIVGSSMTENFRSSWFDEMDLNTVKLSYSGARTTDLRAILEQVYASDNEIKYVFMDVNDYQLTTSPTSYYTKRPDYLYDGKVWNDGEYLLNNDIFWMSVGRVAEKVLDKQPDIDDAYTWEDPELFSGASVLNQNRYTFENLRNRQAEGNIPEYDREKCLNCCKDNINNVLPIIEQHPETQFVIFLPPYSMVYWEERILYDELEVTLEMYHNFASKLLERENVRVFYFQDEEEIIKNLDLYRDSCHYAPQINRYIFDCIKDGKQEVTEDTLEERIRNMYRIASEYNYQEMWDKYE